MNWAEVCEHPSLKNLPFKIELNEYGNIIMSPVKFDHSAYQGEILRLLTMFVFTGRIVVESAIETRKGIKVADVAWLSQERFDQNRHQTACIIAPEICVEVISPGNNDAEIQEKRSLYFEHGAQEVWICEESGEVNFYDASGQLDCSRLVPDFPRHVEI
jgi:Uma2 family endonuclease